MQLGKKLIIIKVEGTGTEISNGVSGARGKDSRQGTLRGSAGLGMKSQ